MSECEGRSNEGRGEETNLFQIGKNDGIAAAWGEER